MAICRAIALELLFLLLTLATSSAVAGATTTPRVDVHVQHSDGALVIVASARLDADAPTAWSVLTDYARYRDFMPGVHASRVVARHGTSVVVEQSDELPLWRWRVPVQVTYEIDEFPPARLQSHARAPPWPPLDSTFVVDQTEAGIRLDYVGRVGPGMPMVARLAQPALEHTVVGDFQALVREIERRTAAARVAN